MKIKVHIFHVFWLFGSSRTVALALSLYSIFSPSLFSSSRSSYPLNSTISSKRSGSECSMKAECPELSTYSFDSFSSLFGSASSSFIGFFQSACPSCKSARSPCTCYPSIFASEGLVCRKISRLIYHHSVSFFRFQGTFPNQRIYWWVGGVGWILHLTSSSPNSSIQELLWSLRLHLFQECLLY